MGSWWSPAEEEKEAIPQAPATPSVEFEDLGADDEEEEEEQQQCESDKEEKSNAQQSATNMSTTASDQTISHYLDEQAALTVGMRAKKARKRGGGGGVSHGRMQPVDTSSLVVPVDSSKDKAHTLQWKAFCRSKLAHFQRSLNILLEEGGGAGGLAGCGARMVYREPSKKIIQTLVACVAAGAAPGLVLYVAKSAKEAKSIFQDNLLSTNDQVFADLQAGRLPLLEAVEWPTKARQLLEEELAPGQQAIVCLRVNRFKRGAWQDVHLVPLVSLESEAHLATAAAVAAEASIVRALGIVQRKRNVRERYQDRRIDKQLCDRANQVESVMRCESPEDF